MCICYLICIAKKNNGIVDMFWGMGFVGIAFLNLVYNESRDVFSYVLTSLIALWGIRLSVFLGIRNWGKEEDFRYANWRKEWGQTFYWRTFLQVHMLQGFFMFIIALPIIQINQSTIKSDHPVILYSACIIAFIAIAIEGIADYQKYIFRKNTLDKEAFIQSGLWKYSRHPNYFGEILFWWALFLFASQYSNWYISLISPLVISFLILYVSGIPMLEKKYDDNITYQAYKKKTSALILWWNKY